MEGQDYAPNKIIPMYDVLRYVVYGILEVEPIPVTEHRSFAAIVEPNFVDAISERKVLRIFGQVIQPFPAKRNTANVNQMPKKPQEQSDVMAKQLALSRHATPHCP